jgi:pyruvate,orthophosphate dikinase
MTSHVSTTARGMGKPCVAGAGGISIDYRAETMSAGDITIHAGEKITLDGSTGEVFAGSVKMIEPAMSGDFAVLMQWADKVRRLRVRANAESRQDAETARKFGAEGIGLCRTEHMFHDAQRIGLIREFFLAGSAAARLAALTRLLPFHREDLRQLFLTMSGLPVTIRLLDPPLHRFLPQNAAQRREVAKDLGTKVEAVRRRVRELTEISPVLGLRGCRLAIIHPEIYQMQARAILESALAVARETGVAPRPEIMIPLVATRRELEFAQSLIDEQARNVFRETGSHIEYRIGTMIELPRAALVADEMAEVAAFFSFGTNDLTQTVFGVSRDDSGRFLPDYIAAGILQMDPFVTIDPQGVGELMRMGIHKGRSVNPNLEVGICGEHAGNPASIAFCERQGLNYISCGPYQVPLARLAAAQAALGVLGSPL